MQLKDRQLLSGHTFPFSETNLVFRTTLRTACTIKELKQSTPPPSSSRLLKAMSNRGIQILTRADLAVPNLIR